MRQTTLELSMGELIRKARLDAGQQQSDLAELVGVSEETISRWERNVTEPTARALKKVELATGAEWLWPNLLSTVVDMPLWRRLETFRFDV